jgi:nucleotide-binding universal stress UspA family protein
MRILWATDGSSSADAAGQIIAKIADPARVEVTVVSVDAPVRSGATDGSTAEEIADRGAEILAGAGIRAATRVERGHPGMQILRIVEEDGYDLSAIGAGSTRWLGRLLLGSVSMRVLHASPTSVLVAHHVAGSRMPTRVLVGVDGSDDATFAVETLAAFADPARASVKVLSVEEVPTPASAPHPPFGGSVPPTPELLRKLKEVTWGVAEHGAERLGSAGFKAEPAVVPGAPAASLLEEAESDEADLVVVGSRGLGPVSRMLVGSVSDRIARNARAALVCRRLP